MFLGIEIGGTKLQLGVGPGDGTMAGLWRGVVDVDSGAAGIRRQIMQAVPELLLQARIEQGQIRSVGIGFGGPVDDARRTVIKSHQIEGWDDFPLADWIGEMLGLPAILGNDADVAGLAEALFGAGQGLSPVFYITIGSGIGGGLIIDGEIYRGCGRGAAEIGHLIVKHLSGHSLTEGPLESFASGWGIEQSAAGALKQGHGTHSVLARNPARSITARDVAAAAEQGDEFAKRILQAAWSDLADAISQVIALLCPRRIVIGGGVSLMGEKLLFDPLRKLVAQRAFAPFADCYEILPAALGELVVVHGALALARRGLKG